MALRPRIFISTVTSEFGTVRQLAANVLLKLGYDPVFQDIFGTEPGDLRQVLRDKIDGCEGLLQIVGRAYGVEPPPPVDPEFGRVSYTQFEFLYAQQQQKKTWIIVAANGCTCDKPLEELDLPRDGAVLDPLAWQRERRELQDAYVASLKKSGHLRHPVANDTDLKVALHEMKDEFRTLRKRFRTWQTWVGAGLAATVLLLVVIGGGLLWTHREDQKTLAEIKEGQEVTSGRIRVHLLDAAERVRREALAKADAAATAEEREKSRDAAVQTYQNALKRIDELVKNFRRIEGTEQATVVFNEMKRILAEEGVNPALAYLDRQRGDAFAEVRDSKNENRAKLRPYLAGAGLKAVNGQPDGARKDFQELLALDPDWPDLLNDFSWFLCDRADLARTHGTLASAVADSTQALQLARQLNAQGAARPESERLLAAAQLQMADALVLRGGPGDPEQVFANYGQCLAALDGLLRANPDSAQAARDVSFSLERFGDFLATRGGPGDAKQALAHYTRSLEIREKLLAANPDSAQAARNVSVSLNKLANFLAGRGQPGDAEQALAHYTRDLEISEKLLAANPDSAQAARDVSVSLERLGDFLAKRGQPGDAEQALVYYTRDLEISEKLLTANPDSAQAARDVSISLNKLADFLATRGQPGDAEQALAHCTRSLKIREKLLTANPDSAQAARDVSISLNKLADFLATRGQPGDADRALAHYTRSLEIREKLLAANPDSAQAARDVSISLNTLADFLAARGQPGDVEQALAYFTRDLEISEKLLAANPDSAQAARDLSVSLNTLADFLAAHGQPGDADQAWAHYTRSLEIREKLLAANSDSGEAARDVFVSHFKRFRYWEKFGDPAEAARQRRACFEVLHPRVAKGMTFDAPLMRLYERLLAEFENVEQDAPGQ